MKRPYNSTDYYGFELAAGDIEVKEKCITKPTAKKSSLSIYFVLIKNGSGKVQINSQQYEVKRGSVLWLFSYHVYHFSEITEEIELISFKLSLNVLMLSALTTQAVDQHMNFFDYWDVPVLTCREQEFPYLAGLFEQALQETEKRDRLSDLSLLAVLYQVIVWFERSARHYWNQEKDSRDAAAKILMYIHFHFREPLTLQETAETFKLSAQTVNRSLKHLTKKTFGEILSEVRINNAIAMLHFEELEVSYIADFVGYQSIPSFNKQFKRLTGYSPTEMRNDKVKKRKENTFRFQNRLSYEIYTYIHQHYQEEITVETAAKYFYSSPAKIDQIVLAEFSMTFNALLEYNRMLFARSLLLSTSKKISEIAEACGYQSIRTFNRNFLTFWGNTPRKYKELLQ
ncbi:helix-turn-helix transcriptional regulator [Enterococcus termitis]|uniref:helix-turn-helix transcriptional regulator n=1 Tax=Enterococcus termitis TaxID=332950 RepID=UPI00091CF8A7|nr:AraC family transcriptional regulator [Enterococcus termitis]OJG99037.1 hypothetical protein RV18_GL002191 [Enterococcus termitis]